MMESGEEFPETAGYCSQREHLELDESQARLRGADQIRVGLKEASRLSQEVAKARMAELYILLSR